MSRLYTRGSLIHTPGQGVQVLLIASANFCADCKIPRWTAKSLEQAPPDPRPSKGIQKSMLMKSVLTGGAPGA
eukprot:302936-Pelagomonas_calceolata.AAC.3